jgi:putative peptidoglycan lipid II flippase
LYSSTYYALRDTRTPLRYAVLRMVLTTVLGYLAAIVLPPRLGIDRLWGTAGLTASAGVSGWIEFLLLRRTLNGRIGQTGLTVGYSTRLWMAALIGAGIAWIMKTAIAPLPPILLAAVTLVPYGLVYFGVTFWSGIPEARSVLSRVRRRTHV